MELLWLSGNELLICILLFAGAILYTSVGHAGSSIYIAIMTLFGLSATVVRPTALVLNIFVATFVSWRFIKEKLFDLSLFIPLALGAIPMAFIGGKIEISNEIYKPLIGGLLLIAGLNFLIQFKSKVEYEIRTPKFYIALLTGAALGLLAGLSGTGGGIFLSPLALIFGWTSIKKISGTAALFILANSLFGLLGRISSVQNLPPSLPIFVTAVLLGALIGTKLGIKQLSNKEVKRALGLVLVIAGFKLISGF